MKIIEKRFFVELTESEIETITTALHAEYKFRREDAEKEQDAPRKARRSADACEARSLRNVFADLIGRRYMGEDA